jgi:hypothetical protein
MPKVPISVTLEADNLLWLKGQAGSGKRRSLSDAIDSLVTAARAGEHGATASRTVVGTVDIAADDPGLDQADAYIRSAIDGSLGRALNERAGRDTDTAASGSDKRRRTRRRRTARG